MTSGVTGLPTQPPLLMEPDQVALNVLGRELIGTALIVAGQAGNRLQIGFLSVFGQTADGEIVDHALT